MRSFTGFLLFLNLSVIGSSICWAVPPLKEAGVRELIPVSNWQKQFKITEGKDLGNVVPLTSVPLSHEKDGSSFLAIMLAFFWCKKLSVR